ncbi:hypothetical protein ACLKA7_002351 [Drosophila subpalustris]
MKLDNFRLIAEVEKRRALWDSTMHLALRKDACTLQWQEVADIMQIDVNICKKRFKGLRDSYRAEVRKIQRRLIEHSNWPYFRPLEFLRIIFDPDKLVPFSPEPCNADYNNSFADDEQSRLDDLIIDLNSDDSFDFEIMGDIFKRETTTDAQCHHDSNSDMPLLNSNVKQNSDMSQTNLSVPQNQSPSLLSPLPIVPPTKRTRRRRTSSAEFPYANGRATPASASETASASAKDDPDYNFLVSLLPHMKTLSSMNNMKFRTEVSRMLMDLNQQQERQSNHNYHHYQHVLEPTNQKLITPNTNNASPRLLHSSIIECDVKIENEPLI